MESIEVNHFKAFGSRIAIIPTATHKNILVYGENGAGKTSLYEAIMMAFYREKLLRPHISVGAPQEQRANEEKDFYNSFNHKVAVGNTAVDFTIFVNGDSFKTFNTDNYQCFMISAHDLNYIQHNIQDGSVVTKDCINIKKLLGRVNFPEIDINNFLSTKISDIIQNVNESLHNEFVEDIEIGQENVEYDIYIKDDPNFLRESNGLHNIFNEAKINLVVILILLHSVLLMQASVAEGKHKLLVLDDLVTSFDNSNRLYLAKFILEKFVNFQKILFTHSIGFNNMVYRCIEQNDNLTNWLTYNLYLTNQGPQIYDFGELKTIGDIKQEFNRGFLQPNTVGNEIRKRFEAGIYELAKIIQLGEVHKATDLVARLISPKPIYVSKYGGKIHGADDLVKSINDIANGTDTPAIKVNNIIAEIQKYSTNADLQKIIAFVKEFHFYEKIVIHSLSHGSAPMPNFNQTEVYGAMALLEKIEKEIKDLKNGVGRI